MKALVFLLFIRVIRAIRVLFTEERTHVQTVNGKKFSTLAIRAGERRDPTTNAHTTPIYQTATFTFETAEEMTQAIATSEAVMTIQVSRMFQSISGRGVRGE